MYSMMKTNKLYLLITFIMSAILASSSQTLTVLEQGSDAESNYPNLLLSQSLEPGMVLHIITAATSSHSDLDIKDIDDNILLRVNTRLYAKLIATNSNIGGWGKEISSRVVLKEGVKYSLHIVVHLNGYRIFVNGEEIHFFKHRRQAPGVSIEMLTGGKWYSISHKFNEPKWAVQQSSHGMYIKEYSDDGIQSPHEIQFQGTYPLSSIIITGIIDSNTDTAVVRLLNTFDEDIFHLSIRFKHNSVVRNSYTEGAWGIEETNGEMVFKRNERFTLAIDVEVDDYKVYVDGVEFITYKHRTPYYNAAKLIIEGGMNIFKTVYQK